MSAYFERSSSRRRLVAVSVAAAVLGALVLLVGPLERESLARLAHGDCDSTDNDPYLILDRIEASGAYFCTNIHAKLKIDVWLQKETSSGSGIFENKAHAQDTCFNNDGCSATAKKLCPVNGGRWRTKVYGEAYNSQGDLIHWDTEYSPDRWINC